MTGASSGIGRAVAVEVADAGGSVVAVGRRTAVLEELVAGLPGEGHRVCVADLSVAEERAELVAVLELCHGVVHAAGILRLLPVSYIQERGMRETGVINYEAPVLLTQALVKRKKLAEGGSVVFVSSVAGRIGAKGHSLYAGSKGALEAAARCVALELAGRKVRVNCIAPGMVRTAMAEEATSALGAEAMSRHEEDYPLGFGSPEDVGRCAVFLLAEASRWVTGTVLTCDGGFSAGR